MAQQGGPALVDRLLCRIPLGAGVGRRPRVDADRGVGEGAPEAFNLFLKVGNLDVEHLLAGRRQVVVRLLPPEVDVGRGVGVLATTRARLRSVLTARSATRSVCPIWLTVIGGALRIFVRTMFWTGSVLMTSISVTTALAAWGGCWESVPNTVEVPCGRSRSFAVAA